MQIRRWILSYLKTDPTVQCNLRTQRFPNFLYELSFKLPTTLLFFRPFSSNFPLAGLPQKGPIFESEPVEFKDWKKLAKELQCT